MAAPTAAEEPNGATDNIKVEAITQSLSTVKFEAAEKSKPTLMTLPLEIRRLIYKEFHISQTNSWQDMTSAQVDKMTIMKPFWVCQQMRAEAWEYFCNAHQWFQIAEFRAPASKASEDEPPRLFAIPSALLSADKIKLIKQRSMLTVRSGYGCGRKKLKSDAIQSCLFFAVWNIGYIQEVTYHTYTTMLDYASGIGIGMNPCSIDLAPQNLRNWHTLVPQTLLPLILSQKSSHTRFTMLMELPFFHDAANYMLPRPASIRSEHNLFYAFLEEGNWYLQQDNPFSAFVIFELGMMYAQINLFPQTNHPDFDCVEYTTSRAICSSLLIGISKAINEVASSVNIDVLPNRHAMVLYEVIAKWIPSEQSSFFPGLSQSQRYEYHLQAAKACEHLATWPSAQLPNKVKGFARLAEAESLGVLDHALLARNLGPNTNPEVDELIARVENRLPNVRQERLSMYQEAWQLPFKSIHGFRDSYPGCNMDPNDSTLLRKARLTSDEDLRAMVETYGLKEVYRNRPYGLIRALAPPPATITREFKVRPPVSNHTTWQPLKNGSSAEKLP